ncbi:DNA helicase [Staphylococcus phage vB_SauH_DELF3]|nr:DNA helicase [Staphylococcus phage vB_SauH_DELF3]
MKTVLASGILDQLLPQLEKGESIAFFTSTTEIFNQSQDRLSERLNIPVGKVGSGKFDVKAVTVVMIPTVNSNLKDPTEGVKVSAKVSLPKKIAKEILPKFAGGKNHERLRKLLLESTTPKTKVEQHVLDKLQDIYHNSKTDAVVLMLLNNHNVIFQKEVRKKNQKSYDKNRPQREFLDSIAVMIVNEAVHSKSDSWYTSLMSCENALYRIALCSPIDMNLELLWIRMQALFGDIIVRTSIEYLIEPHYSSRRSINIIPVANPDDIDNIKDYRDAYNKGIVHIEFRNKIIAKLTGEWYNQDKATLIIINFVERGEILSTMLGEMGVENFFKNGEIESDMRKQKLDEMRNGTLGVMIATSRIDEGVDISGIRSLILGAGGKSLRQTLQRVGRALRKKKEDNTTQIFDFNDMTHKFLYSHSNERRKVMGKEKFEIKELEK